MAHFPILIKVIASLVYWIRRKDIKKSQPHFIVFTGSSGKTTTRYLVDYTLKKLGYNSISPQAGYTNEIGVVLASLGIQDVSLKKITTWKNIFFRPIPKDFFACIELGADFRSDIPWFLKRFKADIIVLTDSDQRHWFDGDYGIKEDRQQLFKSLTPQGALVFNSDHQKEVLKKEFTKTIEITDLFKNDRISISYLDKKYLFKFSRHLFPPQISALSLTLGLVDALKRLSDLNEDFFIDYVFPEERLEIKRLGQKSAIIANTYKAIPNCTEWFLKNARQIEANKKILVLSEMKPNVIDNDLYYGEILKLFSHFSKVYFIGSKKVFNILKNTNTPIEKTSSKNDFADLCKKIIDEAGGSCVVFLKSAQSFGFDKITRKLSSSSNE